jgi:endonuclease-3
MVASEPQMAFARVMDVLLALYGEPRPPPATRLFELVLWENVAYLVDDERRGQAFQVLRARVGTTPSQILAASNEALLAVTRAGILAEHQAAKLRRSAQIVCSEFGGDLEVVRLWPEARARRALQKFPSIGQPGAAKILLFARSHPTLALDSNGVRTLLRLGFGQEAKSYTTTYRSVLGAIQDQLTADYPSLIRAHQLLRRHGQELCRTNQPHCTRCPLASACRYSRITHSQTQPAV